jgi:hypothetical protein
MAVDELLQVANLLSQNLLGGDFASLTGVSGVLFLEDVLFDSELLDYSLERFHKDFKLADALVTACSNSYRIFLLLAVLSRKPDDFINFFSLRLFIGFDRC